MNKELLNRCRLLVENRNTMKSAFKWENDSMGLAGSAIFTNLGKKIDLSAMKEAKKVFKENVGLFSGFRSEVKIPFMCKMVISGNPLKYFKTIEKICGMLKAKTTGSSQYRVLAAMTICDHVKEDEYQKYVNKTYEIYKKMKETHKWLTASDDIPFAAMLAVTDINIDTLFAEIEKCFEGCKGFFKNKNARQTLSHVLALSTLSSEEKCRKTGEIWKLLKNSNHKFGTNHEIAILGTLISLDLSTDDIVKHIVDADEYLKQEKGFGNLALGAEKRRMYAAIAVMCAFKPEDKTIQETVLSSSMAIAIQMEVCITLMLASAVAATATASINS